MKNNKKFKIVIIIYIILFALACVYGAVVPAEGNTKEHGATIYFPAKSSVVSDTFSVNGSIYAKSGIAQAELVLKNSDNEIIIPIEQEKILHDDRVIETLSTFKTSVSAADGNYDLSIRIKENNGTLAEFPSGDITVQSGVKVDSFSMFSSQHLITLGIITILFIFIFVFFKDRKKSHIIFAYICALLIMTGDVYSRIWLIFNGTFRASYDMALHMCDISGIMVPIFLFMEPSKTKDKIYNLMFIWGLGGALMALLTPEMGGYAFPSYYYFNFFIKHSMIIFAVLIVTFFEGMRPKLKQLGWVMLISTVIVGAIYGIDWLVRLIPPFEPGNYMFLSYPPTGGSLIDMLVMIFGPSPYYIIGLEVVGALVYIVLWLPFYIASKISKKTKRA